MNEDLEAIKRHNLICQLCELYNTIPADASVYHVCDILLGYIERKLKTAQNEEI